MSSENSENRDVWLIRQIADGDKRAFEELFGEYGSRIFRYAARMIGDPAKAEEVTNDVMLEVWKSAAKFEGRSRPSTWILGIARHRALNAVRGKAIDTIDIDDAPEPVDETPAPQPDDGARVREQLKTALARLSPDHRDVIELTFFHGRSYQEIAEIVGCPLNTVKTRMFHAKKQLQTVLRQFGLEELIAGDGR